MDQAELKKKISSLTEEQILEKLRARRPARITEQGLKPSAVLVPLIFHEKGLCLLVEKRSRSVNAHKGEISFPGGVIEPGESAVGAALREMREETGVAQEKIRILGELDEIVTITGFSIRPFVARIEWPVHIHPNESEIESVYILPLADFLDPERFKEECWRRGNEDYPVYFYALDACTVWGATAKITKNLIDRISSDILV